MVYPLFNGQTDQLTEQLLEHSFIWNLISIYTNTGMYQSSSMSSSGRGVLSRGHSHDSCVDLNGLYYRLILLGLTFTL